MQKGFTVEEGDDVLLGGFVGQAPQPDNVVAVVQVFDGVAGLLQRPVHLAFLGLKNWKQKNRRGEDGFFSIASFRKQLYFGHCVNIPIEKIQKNML